MKYSNERSMWLFSDELGHEDDIKRLRFIFEQLHQLPFKLKPTTNVKDLEDLPSDAICFIDYGAMCVGGMFEWANNASRYLRNLIDRKSSVDFIFILTMGKDVYEADELFEFPNVQTVDGFYLSEFIAANFKK